MSDPGCVLNIEYGNIWGIKEQNVIIALVSCITVGELVCHDKQRNSTEHCSMSTVAEHHARPGDCSGISREGKED